MQKRIWTAVFFAGLVFTVSNSFTAKADTALVIPIVSPSPFVQQTESGASEGPVSSSSAGPGSGLKNGSSSSYGPGIGPGAGAGQGISSAEGEAVVAYARRFLGNPYVYGGTSLTEGADCSGFVQSIFKEFGITLPRTSWEQGESGIEVDRTEDARPGDLIVYSGHIGIYIGQSQLIHASGPEDGIKISSVNMMPVISIRRVLNN